MTTPEVGPVVVEEEEKGVRLSDHLDVSSVPHDDDEQKTSTPSTPSTASTSSTRSPSFFDLRIAVVGNVDSGKVSIPQTHSAIPLHLAHLYIDLTTHSSSVSLLPISPLSSAS